MRNRLLPVFTFGLLLLRASALASFLDGVSDFPAVAYEPVRVSYYAPNEENPAASIPLMAKAAVGAQMAVGTERAFMGLALNPNATCGVFIDRDPGVRLYNQINILLLKLADGDRQQYLSLRFAGNLRVWSDSLKRILRASPGILDPRDLKTLTYDNFQFWHQKIWDPHFDRFHDIPSQSGDPFWGANYLFDDTLFKRLSSLATEGRIRAIQLNFRDTPRLEKLVAELRREGIQVSVLDLSNAWWPSYLGSEQAPARQVFGQLLRTFAPIAGPSSVLLVTHDANVPRRRLLSWRYISAPLSQKSVPDAEALYDRLGSSRESSEAIRMSSPGRGGRAIACLISYLGF